MQQQTNKNKKKTNKKPKNKKQKTMMSRSRESWQCIYVYNIR